MVTSKIKHVFIKFLKPIIAFFGKLGIHPNVYTILGLLLSITAGVLISLDYFLYAIILLFLGSIMDFLDGNVARYLGIASKKGGFLDSILDRISDMAVLAGFVIGQHVDVITGTIMIIASVMISYIRAKGESLGIKKMAVGLMERTERLFFVGVLMIVALAAPNFKNQAILTAGIITVTGFSIGYMVITFLCVITVLHRFIYCLIQFRKMPKELEKPENNQEIQISDIKEEKSE
ncbi:MAG: CDP-alcohol phosphatidyltransferase family protein [Asgard group archaeon]|nr:CDP-alcohol phosphatidyltransferase family protein [Asgard group archaeon]